MESLLRGGNSLEMTGNNTYKTNEVDRWFTLHCQESGGSSQAGLVEGTMDLCLNCLERIREVGEDIFHHPQWSITQFHHPKKYSKSPWKWISQPFEKSCAVFATIFKACVKIHVFCPSWHFPSIPLPACDHFHTRLWCQTMWQKQLSWPLKKVLRWLPG